MDTTVSSHFSTTEGTFLELTVIVYGSNYKDAPDMDTRFGPETDSDKQRRLELELRPTIPASHNGSIQSRHEYLKPYLQSIKMDIKHSKNWRCEFCSKHARETIWQTGSWMHLTPPKMNVYVHNLCDAMDGPCAETFRLVDADFARMNGSKPKPLQRNITTPGVFPMAASCKVCNEEDPRVRLNLKRCNRCKVTRYCGVDCQKPDWEQHKIFCKTVKDVKWVWE